MTTQVTERSEPVSKLSTGANFSWSTKELEEAQASDPAIAEVVGMLKENKKPNASELQLMGPDTRAIWARCDSLEMRENVLYLKPENKRKHFKSRVVLPKSLVKAVLQRIHDGPE